MSPAPPPEAVRAILIAGATASGKSALALALARRIGGTIINADSMQVYEDLAIITARPSAADERAAPHLLYGFVSGREAYSVGRYVTDCTRALAACLKDGRVPIIVGGTGLYFKAILSGLAPVPDIPESIRTHWRGEMARAGPLALHRLLATRDPRMARQLRPSDPQRIVRALEVLDATGRSLAAWQEERGTPVVAPGAAVRIVLDVGREELIARAEARLEAMIAAGVVEEVRALVAKGYPPDVPVLRAVGVAPFAAHAAGLMPLEKAREITLTETRAYIKRQLTWIRGQMADWTSLKPADAPAFLEALPAAAAPAS